MPDAPTTKRTSRLALASLALAVSGILLLAAASNPGPDLRGAGLGAAIGAITCGLLALRAPHGRHLAAAGILLGLALIFVSPHWVPQRISDGQIPRQAYRGRVLFNALALYCEEHDNKIPASLKDIIPFIEAPPRHHSAPFEMDPQGFTLLHSGDKLGDLAEEEPVIVSELINKKIKIVVHADGSVVTEDTTRPTHR